MLSAFLYSCQNLLIQKYSLYNAIFFDQNIGKPSKLTFSQCYNAFLELNHDKQKPVDEVIGYYIGICTSQSFDVNCVFIAKHRNE